MNHLTSYEQIAIVDLWHSSDGNGHDFGFGDDIERLPKESRGGVLSSLAKKGLLDVCPAEKG